jgi:hypothetical protein
MWMRSSRVWMRSSRVVRALSGCQNRNSPVFDPSILGHSGIWGAADEAVLNNEHKKAYCTVYISAQCYAMLVLNEQENEPN